MCGATRDVWDVRLGPIADILENASLLEQRTKLEEGNSGVDNCGESNVPFEI
jgi:hypothetical protein